MKKLFLFFTAVWFAASPVQATETSGIFSNDTFMIAKAVKIGRNATVISAPAYTASKETGGFGGGGGTTSVDVCRSDSDCELTEKCASGGECVSACKNVDCSSISGSQCIAENHKGTCKTPCERAEVAKICTDKGLKCVGNGKCVQCTQNSDCGSNGICTTFGYCLIKRPLCTNKTCGTGHYCSIGRCIPYPLGSTNDPQCSNVQVADGNGGCKSPCDGVTCPLGKQCTVGSGTGKACCGDCLPTLVASTPRLNTLYTKLNTNITAKPLVWNRKLNLCLPKFEAVDIVMDDFKKPLLRKPYLYTGFVRAVELDDTLTGSNKTVSKLIDTTYTVLPNTPSITLDTAVSLRSDAVALEAINLPANSTMTVQKDTLLVSPSYNLLTVQ